MIELIVDNIFIEIKNASKETEYCIWDKLSFEVKEFNTGNNFHPTIRHLFNRKTKRTYTGLLSYIIEILEERQDEYEIIDKRIKPAQNADYNLVKYIDENIPFKLRDYQEHIVNNCSDREIIQGCTGCGKTAIMAALIAKFKVKPVSILADKLSLCMQLREEFSKFLGEDIGLIGGGINEPKDITVYSVQSATEDIIKDTKLLMIDECFVYETIVKLANGKEIEIGELVNNYDKNNKYRIVSFNHETGEKENKNLISVAKIPLKQMLMTVLIKHNTDIIRLICTPEHPFYYNR